jgi:alpha-tubulin suppressor-like RCC1 family protein/sugar lactone lactonase YvrE
MKLVSAFRWLAACMVVLLSGVVASAQLTYDFSTSSGLSYISGYGIGGAEMDGVGNLYVTNGTVIMKLSTSGTVTSINHPFFQGGAITVDASNNLYFVDAIGRWVVKASPTGTEGGYTYTLLDGGHGFNLPKGVAVDSAGNVYVAEMGTGKVWKITPGGAASTFATFAASGSFEGPSGLAVDSGGNVYVSILSSSSSVQKITPEGDVSTFAAVRAEALCIDRADTLYGISGNTISRISPAGLVTTAVGPGGTAVGITVDPVGNVYVLSGGYVYRGVSSQPLNDSFDLAGPMTGTFAQLYASNIGASKEAGEPDIAGEVGGHSLWWKWTAPAEGTVVLTTRSALFTPLMAVYTGASVDALTLVSSSGQGVVTFNAAAGATYNIAVDGPGSATGTVLLALNPSGIISWGATANAPSAIGPVSGMSGDDSGILSLKRDGSVVSWIGNGETFTGMPAGLSDVTAVAAGSSYRLALKSDGTVVSWGSGTAAPSSSVLANVVAIAAGYGNGVALKGDGTIASWGNLIPSSTASQVSGVVGISAKNYNYLLLRSDGSVIGGGNSSSPPSGLSGIVAVAAGGNFGLALKSDGTVVSWGTISSLDSSLNNNLIAIAAGVDHALALKSDGTVVAWGDNYYGRATVPAHLTGIVGISACRYTSLALQAVAPPVFSAQPVSVAIDAGKSATLVASANAFSYQWYRGTSGDTSAPVADATKPWLVTGALGTTTLFWVRATNALGITDSRTATVTVDPKPANDDFSGATALTGASVAATGTNKGASWETGEQNLVYNLAGLPRTTTGRSVWWTWTAPSDGVVTMDTQGSDFANVLSVYSGGSFASLHPVARGSISGGANTSKSTFQVTAGATYLVAVNGSATDYGVATGNITLNIALATAYAPVITAQPAPFTISNGVSGTVSVSYLAYPLPGFQWQRLAAGSANWVNLSDDATFSGSASATLGMTAGTAMYGDQFRCIVDNGLSAPVTSSPAPLVVSVPYVYTTYAGTAKQSGNVDAVGVAARFTHPAGLALDAAGNLYAADDQAHVIRKIAVDGMVTTLAGLAGQSGYVDGQGSTARFNRPRAVAVDTNGTVYIADTGNNAIRKITTDGIVTTLAGSPATSVFSTPSGVAVDAGGTVYVADTYHNNVSTITPAGVVNVLAGSSSHFGTADGVGIAAQFAWPYGIAVDGGGTVYVADYFYGIIRKIAPGAVVTTLAGATGAAGGIDGLGVNAGFGNPTGLTIDAYGNVFVADSLDDLIRKISPDGVVSTIGGLRNYIGSTDSVGTTARFYSPSGIVVDPTGILFIADSYNYTVRKGVPVATSPFITFSPVPQTVTTSQDVTFTTFADGFPMPVYRWQSLPVGASTWTDVADGGLFFGSGTSTLAIAGGPIDLAGEQFRCVVTNGIGMEAIGGAATMTVTVPAFADWAGSLGLIGSDASASAVPFTDGIPNLARYAMNLGTSPPAGQLPSLGYETVGMTNYVALQFRERKGMDAVLLGAESSTDLQSWHPLSPDAIIPLPDDDMNTARFKAMMPIPAGGRVFIRLRAEQNP